MRSTVVEDVVHLLVVVPLVAAAAAGQLRRGVDVVFLEFAPLERVAAALGLLLRRARMTRGRE